MANTTHHPSFNPLARFAGLLFARQTPLPHAATHPGIFASLAGAFNAWRARRAAAAELFALSDRELADIGLTRQQIPEAVRRNSPV